MQSNCIVEKSNSNSIFNTLKVFRLQKFLYNGFMWCFIEICVNRHNDERRVFIVSNIVPTLVLTCSIDRYETDLNLCETGKLHLLWSKTNSFLKNHTYKLYFQKRLLMAFRYPSCVFCSITKCDLELRAITNAFFCAWSLP